MYSHEFDKMVEEGTDVEAMKKELIRQGEEISELQDKLRDFECNQIKLDSKGYLSFGCSNGWTKSPARDYIINKCTHESDGDNIGNCLNASTCHECKFTSYSDSSD